MQDLHLEQNNSMQQWRRRSKQLAVKQLWGRTSNSWWTTSPIRFSITLRVALKDKRLLGWISKGTAMRGREVITVLYLRSKTTAEVPYPELGLSRQLMNWRENIWCPIKTVRSLDYYITRGNKVCSECRRSAKDLLAVLNYITSW